MGDRRKSVSSSSQHQTRSRKVDKPLQDITLSYPYICDVCKGNDALLSVLQSSDVKIFIGKIAELTLANDKLSDQVSVLKTLDLHIQHIILNPKSLVVNNDKIDKLGDHLKRFEAEVTEKTSTLQQLMIKNGCSTHSAFNQR